MGLEKIDKKTSEQFTWASFIEYYNSLIDHEILSFCKDKKHSYYGGKCTISSTINEDEFTRNTFLIVVSVLYYNEEGNEEVVERKIKSRFNYREFVQERSTLSMLRKLLKESIEFNIESPIKGGKK